MPGGVRLLLDVLQFVLLAGAWRRCTAMCPTPRCIGAHAWAGGAVCATVGPLSWPRRCWCIYLGNGAHLFGGVWRFATVPILLVWIYVAWVIVLLGAVVTAYLPSLMRACSGAPARTVGNSCWLWRLCSSLRVRVSEPERGAAQRLAAGWLQEERPNDDARLVLLADPDTTLLAPLFETLLLRHEPSTQNLWKNSLWRTLYMRSAL
jgi:membrane protein